MTSRVKYCAAFFLFLILGGLFISAIPVKENWGFFGHRRINRLAVFTLPPEIIPIYKHHIEYLTEHAVDPDKRRYATRHEAVRHYIDVDHWGKYPFKEVPRNWSDALQKYTSYLALTENGDTLEFMDYASSDWSDKSFVWKGKKMEKLTGRKEISLDRKAYAEFFDNVILPQYYEDEWKLSPQQLNSLLAPAKLSDKVIDIRAVDHFSEYGIVPYHLLSMQRRLTKEFERKNTERILQLSAEFGHYIADAHVPLHTTENYNGQMTGQTGIHAFWESRIPELFADEEFDYFVGKAEYIDDPANYYWDIVLKSHSYLDSLLYLEKQLKNSYPADQQYCYEERNGQTIRTQCKEYTKAYHRSLGDQVESRMRASILSIGSAWYTAWVDAGQPDLRDIFNLPIADPEPIIALPGLSEKQKQKARPHQ